MKVGSNITLYCPVEEELNDPIKWVPNKINDYDYCEYGDYSATLKVTFPSSILSENGELVWCDYEGHHYYAIILISGMFNYLNRE